MANVPVQSPEAGAEGPAANRAEAEERDWAELGGEALRERCVAGDGRATHTDGGTDAGH